jgi:aromatic ring-cleaving dioxygenase
MPKLSKVGVRFEWDDVLLKRMVVNMIANAARRVGEIKGFHVHVYYHMDATRETALALREHIAALFPLRVS